MASIEGSLSVRTTMPVNGLPFLFRVIALLAGGGPVLAMADQTPLTSQAAQRAVVQVLAGPDPTALSALTGGMGLVSILCLLAVLLGALAKRWHTPAPQGHVQYTPLPPPPDCTDVAARVERLRDGSPAEALSLLYQALLTRLGSDYHLHISSSATEPQVLVQVAALQLSGLEAFTRRLVEQWQLAVYAERFPDTATWHQLLAGWRHLFPSDTSA